MFRPNNVEMHTKKKKSIQPHRIQQMCTRKADHFFALYNIHGEERFDSCPSSCTFTTEEKEKSVLAYAKISFRRKFPMGTSEKSFLTA